MSAITDSTFREWTNRRSNGTKDVSHFKGTSMTEIWVKDAGLTGKNWLPDTVVVPYMAVPANSDKPLSTSGVGGRSTVRCLIESPDLLLQDGVSEQDETISRQGSSQFAKSHRHGIHTAYPRQ